MARPPLSLRDDGLPVGFLLTQDFAAVQTAMGRTEVNERWQAAMAPFFMDVNDRRPDQGMLPPEQVFHPQTALDEAGLPPTPSRPGGTP